MAAVFSTQGQYEKGLKWLERALAGRQKSLGVHHPDTLHAVSNMAFVFGQQRQYEKALEWYERTLVAREKALGVNHLDTLNTVNA